MIVRSKLLCGDNAEEFEKAANDALEIPFDNSVHYCEMALNCYTLLHNTKKVNGQSPWELTFGEEFELQAYVVKEAEC